MSDREDEIRDEIEAEAQRIGAEFQFDIRVDECRAMGSMMMSVRPAPGSGISRAEFIEALEGAAAATGGTVTFSSSLGSEDDK